MHKKITEKDISRKNIVDIGFAVVLNDMSKPIRENSTNIKWEEVDFEQRCLVHKSRFYMDHDILLDRALDVITMMRDV